MTELPSMPETLPTVVANEISLMSSREFWLSIVILCFGLVVILCQMFLLKSAKEKDGGNPDIATGIRLSVVSMIVVGALVFVASGYSQNQIGPAMGLFGTVAGYLIGQQSVRRE
ncbi:MAG: hypothetical protein ABJK59_00750 [Erythrobacter sp.]|uniref:hypothetical protein n=1 Tax=Erythrobacter sp. TaxID=1042 RepID=UPI0032981CA7